MDPIIITLPGWNQISSYFFPPDSTDDVIIFPFKASSQKFCRTVDSTRITQDKATLDDINNVLTIFELVLSRFDSTRKFLMGLIFPLLIPYLLVLNAYGFYWRSVDKVRFFYMIFAFIVVTYSLYKRMRQTGRTKADIQRMLEMIQPAYAKRGLTWHFSERFFSSWLELKKEHQAGEQESSLSLEVHSNNSQESFIRQQGLTDEENIIVCAGKNLTGPDFSPPAQFRYVIYFIICGYIGVSLISYHYNRYRYYSYSYYY